MFNPSKWLPPHPRLIRFLGNLEDFLQFLVGLFLAIAALVLLGHLLLVFPSFFAEGLSAGVSTFIHDLMLIMIVLELLWTVVTYLQEHTVPLEPFLFVGIISSARKLLLISAQMSLAEQSAETARLQLRELMIHGGLILVLVIALVLVRWTRTWYRRTRKAPLTPTYPEPEE